MPPCVSIAFTQKAWRKTRRRKAGDGTPRKESPVQKITDWFNRLLADTQLMMMFASLLAISALLFFFGKILAPLLVAIALAYVLDSLVRFLTERHLDRSIAVWIVFSTFMLLLVLGLLTIVPLLTDQIIGIASNIPKYMSELHDALQKLQHRFGVEWLNPEHLQQLLGNNSEAMQGWVAAMLKKSFALIPGIIALLVYTVLVPVLIFYLLKDKEHIIAWSKELLPKERSLLTRVWRELDVQIGNYIQGRFWESLFIGLLMWIIFALMGHKYALLLGVLTGVSVWIPFVGAAVVTVPVMFLSFVQWGLSDMTLYAILAYGAVQTFDANIVIPWLFSEVVNLHPIAIIMAVLVFGNLWGFVGVFIAIPMGVLVQSVLSIFLERRDEQRRAE